ncbi:hypothetical protein QBC35DRAFT_456479 [Podospora australis]|uniref:Uncharacterized protein n=1 Tax=Podospora australis TaxID=1536484 RepID=A0AAN6WK11_9PEZI|nr:hypothetical protein QBC35DRAFT_456479 [Podospora australis]
MANDRHGVVKIDAQIEAALHQTILNLAYDTTRAEFHQACVESQKQIFATTIGIASRHVSIGEAELVIRSDDLVAMEPEVLRVMRRLIDDDTCNFSSSMMVKAAEPAPWSSVSRTGSTRPLSSAAATTAPADPSPGGGVSNSTPFLGHRELHCVPVDAAAIPNGLCLCLWHCQYAKIYGANADYIFKYPNETKSGWYVLRCRGDNGHLETFKSDPFSKGTQLALKHFNEVSDCTGHQTKSPSGGKWTKEEIMSCYGYKISGNISRESAKSANAKLAAQLSKESRTLKQQNSNGLPEKPKHSLGLVSSD